MACVRNYLILFISICLTAAAGQPETIQFTRPGQVLKFGSPGAETTLLAALDGGLMVPNNGEITAPQQGEHWLALAARDRLGNVSAVRWVRVLIDSDAPIIELTLMPEPVQASGRAWLPAKARARLEASDPRSGLDKIFLWLNDAETVGAEPNLTIDLPHDGDVKIEASALDQVGNTTGKIRFTASIDSQPPRGVLSVVGPRVDLADGMVVSSAIEIRADFEDPESGVAQWTPMVNGSKVEPSRLVGGWEETRYEVSAQAVDRVGNQSTIGPLTFTVDRTPPRIVWNVTGLTSSKSEGWHQAPITLTAVARDDRAGVASLSWSENGVAWAPLNGPLVLHGERVSLRATDRVGNTAETEAVWRLDYDGPSVTLADEMGAPISPNQKASLNLNQRLALNLADNGCGLDYARYSFDKGNSWRLAPEAFLFEKPGLFQLQIEAFDRLGNRTIRSWTLRVKKSRRSGEHE